LKRADSTTRLVHPLFQVEGGGSNPTSALELHFSATSHDRFAILNKEWHSRLPLIGASRFRVCYGADFGGRYFAVAAWSNPVARLLPQLEWLELRRFAIAPDAPKNTASRMIGWMVRDIRRRFPDVVRLISYQDCEAHRGTIYAAAGWKHAAGYVSRKRAWASRNRAGRTDQAVSPRMRWELNLQESP
jgi:hypothetical protein